MGVNLSKIMEDLFPLALKCVGGTINTFWLEDLQRVRDGGRTLTPHGSNRKESNLKLILTYKGSKAGEMCLFSVFGLAAAF